MSRAVSLNLRHIVRYGVLLLVSSLPAAAAADAYEDALDAFRSDDYPSALIHLKNALEKRPDDLPSLILIGKVHVALEQGAAAEQALLRAQRGGADESLVYRPLGEAYLLQRKFDVVLDEFKAHDHGLEMQMDIMLLRGRAYLGKQDFANAEKELTDASVLFKDHAEPHRWRARALLAQNKNSEAQAALRKAIALAPEDAEIWFLSGELYRLTGQQEKAVTAYGEALQRDPEHVGARVSRAALSIDMGNLALAREDVAHLLEQQPKYPQGVYLSALLLAADGDLDGAESALSAVAAELNAYDDAMIAKHGPSLLLLGTINYRRGNWEAARTYLSRYVESFPAHSGARKQLGAVYLQQNDLERGLALLEKVREEEPDDPQLLGLLGQGYARAGQVAKAREAWARAVEIAPRDAGLRTGLGLSHLAAGRSEDALAQLQLALTLDPEAPRPALLLGALQLRLGDAEAALTSARGLIERDPGNAAAHHLAGQSLLAMNDPAGAREQFELALAARPDFLASHQSLARLDLAQGNPSAARSRLEALAQRVPDNAQVAAALSQVLAQLGQLNEAIRWIRKAVSLDGDDVAFKARLIELYVAAGETELALDVATRMTEQNPEAFAGWYALGRVQLERDDRAAAIPALQRATQVPYLNVSARQLLAVAQYQVHAGDVDGARSTLQDVLGRDRRQFAAHAALAAMDIQQGEPRAALDRAASLREAFPDEAVGYVLSGDALVALEQFDQALEVYAEAVRVQPATNVAPQRFRALWASGNAAAALQELETRRAQYPDEDATARLLGGAYLQSGRYREAMTVYEGLLPRYPADLEVLNNLAWLSGELEDPRGLEFAREALAIAPEDVAVLDTLGWLLVKSGSPQEALPYLRRAQARAAKDPRVAYHLAVSLAETGKRAEARELLQTALQSGVTFDEMDQAKKLLGALSGG